MNVGFVVRVGHRMILLIVDVVVTKMTDSIRVTVAVVGDGVTMIEV